MRPPSLESGEGMGAGVFSALQFRLRLSENPLVSKPLKPCEKNWQDHLASVRWSAGPGLAKPPGFPQKTWKKSGELRNDPFSSEATPPIMETGGMRTALPGGAA